MVYVLTVEVYGGMLSDRRGYETTSFLNRNNTQSKVVLLTVQRTTNSRGVQQVA